MTKMRILGFALKAARKAVISFARSNIISSASPSTLVQSLAQGSRPRDRSESSRDSRVLAGAWVIGSPRCIAPDAASCLVLLRARGTRPRLS
jgi:hypothetical protein